MYTHIHIGYMHSHNEIVTRLTWSYFDGKQTVFKKEINKTQERYYEYVAPDKHCLQAYSPTERLYSINCHLFYTTELYVTTFKMRLCQIVSEHHPASQFKKQEKKKKRTQRCMH